MALDVPDRLSFLNSRVMVAAGLALAGIACVGTVNSDSNGGVLVERGRFAVPARDSGKRRARGGRGCAFADRLPGNGTPPGPAAPALPPTPGFTCNVPMSLGYRTLRLLTRDQYQSSVRDILAVDFDVTKQLPPDAVSGAFVNNNDLSVLEGSYPGYLQVAERIAAWSAHAEFRPGPHLRHHRPGLRGAVRRRARPANHPPTLRGGRADSVPRRRQGLCQRR